MLHFGNPIIPVFQLFLLFIHFSLFRCPPKNSKNQIEYQNPNLCSVHFSSPKSHFRFRFRFRFHFVQMVSPNNFFLSSFFPYPYQPTNPPTLYRLLLLLSLRIRTPLVGGFFL